MGVGGQYHAPTALPPVKTQYPLYRRLGGPQGRSGRVRKISPPTGIRSPDRPVRRESLYRLRYRGRLFLLRCDYYHPMKPLGKTACCEITGNEQQIAASQLFANAGIAISNYLFDSILNPVAVLRMWLTQVSFCIELYLLPTGRAMKIIARCVEMSVLCVCNEGYRAEHRRR